MRRSRLALPGVLLAGATMGTAIAGFPSAPDSVPVRAGDGSAETTSRGTALAGPETSLVPEAPTTTVAVSTTTSTTPTRPPAETIVLVANGSGVRGAASVASLDVGRAGYATMDPTDAGERSEWTFVYYQVGYDREADNVAGLLALPMERVLPMPDPPPVEDPGEASIVLVIGADRAE